MDLGRTYMYAFYYEWHMTLLIKRKWNDKSLNQHCKHQRSLSLSKCRVVRMSSRSLVP